MTEPTGRAKGQTMPGSCNSIAMREYCEEKMAHLADRVELQFKAIDTAYEKASAILDERLGRMNEFREAMKDQASTYVSRDVLEGRLSILDREIDELKTLRSEHKGAASVLMVAITLAIAVVSLVASIVAMVQ